MNIMVNMADKKQPKAKVDIDESHKKVYVLPYMPREKRTFGQKAADAIAEFGGSWTFIVLFLIFLFLWMGLNTWAFFRHWDPYPFILLNLALSCLAAVQAPIILMSQNRAAERDRRKAEMDYIVNKKAEMEIKDMQNDLDEIKAMLRELNKKVK